MEYPIKLLISRRIALLPMSSKKVVKDILDIWSVIDVEKGGNIGIEFVACSERGQIQSAIFVFFHFKAATTTATTTNTINSAAIMAREHF